MVFSVGETVVYPHHGAALIEAIETRVVKGEEKQYLVLRVAQGDLTVRVPAENAEIVGVREVVGEEEYGHLLVADAIWIGVVLLGATVLTEQSSARAGVKAA